MEISYTYTLVIALFIFIVSLNYYFSTRSLRRKLPPSPLLKLPFIGHLHLINIKLPLHRIYHRFSGELGPIFSLQLGTRLVVVVSSQDLVEECFTKNDVVLANRPHFILGKHIGYNYTTLVGSPYGEHWRNLRRFTTVEIFSAARLNTFLSVREDEVRRLLQNLIAKSGGVSDDRVGLRPLLSELTFNVIMRMVAGKRYFGEGVHESDADEAREFRDLIDQVFKLGALSNPADFFPVLRWIGYKGYEKRVFEVWAKMDSFLQRLIDERRGSKNKSTNAMIDHLISMQESQPDYYTDVILKGIVMVKALKSHLLDFDSQVMLNAGTDTSSVTIEWAMSALLNNPEILSKARSEIDAVVGKDRLVSESDLTKLQYLQHIISETFRLFPAAPMLLPHESSEDCKIGGYDIPRGTILMVNAWAVHRDPAIWDNPSRFRPERFESSEVGSSKLMPFGMGRRSCPGTGLAHRVVGLALASMVQCFEWRRVDEADVDLAEGNGLTMPKAVPLEARCKLRDEVRYLLSRSPGSVGE